MRSFSLFAAGVCASAALMNYMTDNYLMMGAMILLLFLNISQGMNDAK